MQDDPISSYDTRDENQNIHTYKTVTVNYMNNTWTKYTYRIVSKTMTSSAFFTLMSIKSTVWTEGILYKNITTLCKGLNENWYHVFRCFFKSNFIGNLEIWTIKPEMNAYFTRLFLTSLIHLLNTFSNRLSWPLEFTCL
jgi:hypothetical protein